MAACSASFGQVNVDPRSPRPVCAVVDGYKVFSYGEFEVYEVSPTYDERLQLQKGNANPWQKIAPKKSWEIRNNLIGLTPTRMPSSTAVEIEPFKPVSFVDGDPATRGFAGMPTGDAKIARAWVRIDFPRTTKVKAVALLGAPPGDFEVRVHAYDLWEREGEWQTVYEMSGGTPQEIKRPDNTAPNVYQPEDRTEKAPVAKTVYQFDPVPVRELSINSPANFILNGIEVYDEDGNNIALISKGCGVTVSRSQYLYWLSETTQAALWQMQYDLGIKWLRVSYYLSPLILPHVEREPGIYVIDPYTDKLITQAKDCGIEVCLTLGPPTDVEQVTKYAEFMVRHFKGRIRYYEIFNEYYNQDAYGPNKPGPVKEEAKNYVAMAIPVAKAIRKIDPEAKVILVGPCPLVADFILECLRAGMTDLVDVVSWHPYSFPDDTDQDYAPEELDRPRHVWAPPEVRTYADAVEYLRREVAKLGFKGELTANECGAYAIHANRTSQRVSAKYLARSVFVHTSLGVPMLWNETTSLMRPPWQQFFESTPPDLKPAESYYMMRTLCTLTEGAKPASVAAQAVAPIEKLQIHSYALPQGHTLLAVWIAEKSRELGSDDYESKATDLLIEAKEPSRLVGIDLLNGREQELNYSVENGKILIGNLLVSDSPLCIRLEY
ncbi:MAG: hypothetical protein JW889_15735 [Verrucomicrobia bacterium]|nr:hypothetical protein [Verrucomicrobiota bacterium]